MLRIKFTIPCGRNTENLVLPWRLHWIKEKVNLLKPSINKVKNELDLRMGAGQNEIDARSNSHNSENAHLMRGYMGLK